MKPITLIRFLAIVSVPAAGGLFPQNAFAVSCNGGASVEVLITNPTGSTPSNRTFTISGSDVNGYVTCTDNANSYGPTTYTVGANPTPIVITGLNTGLWVHTIQVADSVGSNSYFQYQKGMVLKVPNPTPTPGGRLNPISHVGWTYYPKSFKVVTTGDAGGLSGSCASGGACTLRQSIEAASGTSSTNPLLIWFDSSITSLTMSNTAGSTLNLDQPYVTIDGTNSSGNPWVVGDSKASGDSALTISMDHKTHFYITAAHDTIKGMAIVGGTPSPTPNLQGQLIEEGSGASNTTIDSVRLDGAASLASSCSPNCTVTDNLVHLVGSGATLKNVDGRSANGYAVYAPGDISPTIIDSWFHQNIGNATILTRDAYLTRNTIELAGFRRSDNTSVNTSADGIYGDATSNITTQRNLVRNNYSMGMYLDAIGSSLSNDYVCGNGVSGGLLGTGQGIYFESGSSSATGTGLATAYNRSYGIEFNSGIIEATMTFNNDSAFTANGDKGFRNSSSHFTASATGNQWRNTTGSSPQPTPADYSSASPGGVTVTSPQDYREVSVALNSTHPMVPSNVIRNSQTVRVQGSGFNAIDGNPLSTTSPTCTLGAGATSSYCCNVTNRANSCDASTPPDGQSGKGNCVAIKDSNLTWQITAPSGTTPTTIITTLPSAFSCIGQTNEQLRVSKLNNAGTPLSDNQAYCTNSDPK